MSVGNVGFELQNGVLPIPTTTPIKALNVTDATYGSVCILGYIAGAPGTYAVASDGFTSDFSIGCIMLDLTNAIPYRNSGTVAAPTWTSIT